MDAIERNTRKRMSSLLYDGGLKRYQGQHLIGIIDSIRQDYEELKNRYNDASDIIDSLRQENESMKAVVEAAKEWKEDFGDDILLCAQEHFNVKAVKLFAAIDALKEVK
jgi:predicted nuclease with TOPRIM domain